MYRITGITPEGIRCIRHKLERFKDEGVRLEEEVFYALSCKCLTIFPIRPHESSMRNCRKWSDLGGIESTRHNCPKFNEAYENKHHMILQLETRDGLTSTSTCGTNDRARISSTSFCSATDLQFARKLQPYSASHTPSSSLCRHSAFTFS
jgi:hypothetical protein